MADISISINPAETISANISPPNSISIGPSTSYPPHGLSHAPGAYDSLSAYYVATGSTGNFVTGSVVRPSQTGQFVSTGNLDQTIDGHKTFIGSVTLGADGQGGVPALICEGQGVFTFLGQDGGNSPDRAFIRGANYLGNGQTESSISMDCGGGEGISISGNSINLYAPTRPTYNGTGIMLLGEIGETGYLTGYVKKSETGSFITTSQTGQFVSTGSTGQFVTGSVVRPSQTGAFLTTGAADSRYALQSATGNFVTTGQTGNFLTSGTPLEIIQVYGKNDESFTLYKGQAVYIGGANGANPLIKRASNTGEPTSSKTIGLLAQNLNANDFGYIVSEGILEGFDTSAATAGDPMWLGTTGNLLFGTGNKPYGNNHLVYLGVVLRSQSSNGKVYIKPQNGFEIEELHRVYAKNAISKDTLMYDSTSGSWFARQISTGDVSGISSYVLQSATGSFITSSQTGQFVTTGQTGVFLTTEVGASKEFAVAMAIGLS